MNPQTLAEANRAIKDKENIDKDHKSMWMKEYDAIL